MACRAAVCMAWAICFSAQFDVALGRHSHKQHHRSILREGRHRVEVAEDDDEGPWRAPTRAGAADLDAMAPLGESLAQAQLGEGEDADAAFSEAEDEAAMAEAEAQAAAEEDAEADSSATDALEDEADEHGQNGPIMELPVSKQAEEKVEKKVLALGRDGSLRHVDTDSNAPDVLDKSFEPTGDGDFDRLASHHGYRGKWVGVDSRGKVRHQYRDLKETAWYPVTQELSKQLPTEIASLQAALKTQHEAAKAAYDESVKYRGNLRDLISELTHYQEGEHKFRDQVYARENTRSNLIKEDMEFNSKQASPEAVFNERGRDTKANHDRYMENAFDSEDANNGNSKDADGQPAGRQRAERGEQAGHFEGGSFLQTGDSSEDPDGPDGDDRLGGYA